MGHPVVEDNFDHKNKDSIRGRYSIEKDDVLITAMLGSRESEVERMGVTFIDALNRVYRSIDKKLVVAFPYVSENTKLSIKKIAKRATFDFFFCNQSEKKNIFVASDFALVKSGTSSLELAVAKVPMVVAYKVNWLSALIARYIIGLKGYISIINILARKQIIPEFIQDKCNAENLSVALLNLMHKDSKRQISLVQREIAKLRANKTTPSQEAAKAVFD